MRVSDLQRALSQFFWPNGVMVLLATVLIASGLVNHAIAQVADYAVVAVLAAGLMVAWRFHAVRSMAALLVVAGATLFMRNVALVAATPSEAHAVHTVLAILIAVDALTVLLVEEFTLSVEPLAYWVGFLVLQSGVVALAAGPAKLLALEAGWRPSWWPEMELSPLPLVMFALAGTLLLVKFARERRSLDAGLAWSLLPSFAALNAPVSLRTAYMAAAGIAITISVVETSYQLAYEDELTRLPGRRAFNQTIAALDDRYSIAIVDVDHFKKFNDTYGHDIGDQVLRMVAARLASVTGDGRPFRCGGEEFAVVFPGKTADQAMEHMELLRQTIEQSTFNVRGPDRSQRKRPERRYRHSSRHLQNQHVGTTVTVSIGLAQPRSENDEARWVIEAADKALYAAKERGRNRLVVAKATRRAAAG